MATKSRSREDFLFGLMLKVAVCWMASPAYLMASGLEPG